ncbi:MAG: cellulase family glycosylhydrolase [Fidelibacterota bacterium]
MKNHLARISFILLLTATILQGFYRTSGKEILDNSGNPVLLKGIGLGGWLVPEGYMLKFPGFGSPTSIHHQILDVVGDSNTEEFFQRYHANYVTRDDILQLKEWGYNHIRLPFHYNIFEDEPLQFSPEGFAIIDTFMSWCHQAGMPVILDMHCAPGGQNPGNISDSDGTARLWLDEKFRNFTIEIWKAIAAYYTNDTLIIGYDLINEPVLPEGHSNLELRGLMMDITIAIRQVDPNHIIFVEGNWYATDFNQLTPPFDGNMVYSFHKYWNETDTDSFNPYTALRNTWNVPLWLGETGENSNDWHFEALRMAEKLNIGWCTWTHKKFETITSPWSASLPEGFDELLNYWSGNGAKPNENLATALLFQFAENLKTENCTFHSDILYAQIHPEYGIHPIPYAYHVIPGIIEAVNYDMGIQGQTYADNEYKKTRWDVDMPWNLGYCYRNDGVDIQPCSDTNGSTFNIGWTEPGEWLNYTVNVQVSGFYTVNIRVATPNNNGQLRLTINDEAPGYVIDIPATGGWQIWDSVCINDVCLSEGTQILTLHILSGSFNLNQLSFTLTSNEILTPLLPTAFIGNAYPNPFNSTIKIPLLLQGQHRVTIDIYNVQGTKVITLVDEKLGNGYYNLEWNGQNKQGTQIASGIYFARITVNQKKITQKLVFVQ